MKGTKKYVHSVSDLPEGEHYAILTTGSAADSYDGRSTVSVIEYVAFTDRAEWEAEIKQMSVPSPYQNKSFKAIHVRPATIKVSVEVAIR